MTTVSALAKKLLRLLSKSPSEDLSRARDYETLVSEIRKSNDPALIIELLPFVLTDSEDAQAAAETIHNLVTAKPWDDLPALEHTLRERSPYLNDALYQWLKVTPKNVDQLERFGDASTSLLGIASFHWNGYVREEAVKRLSRLTNGFEVPFLVLRLNDWVAEVRDAARERIYARCKPEYCRAFIASFRLLSYLGLARRADHTAILAAVNQLLLSEECRGELLQSLKSEDRFVRRASFKLALNLTGVELKHVVELALEDDDTAIRGWAAQLLSSSADEALIASFTNRIRHDRFMPMRRAALRILVKLNSPDVIDELRAALLDSHISIREEARYHLKNIQPLDVADFYRQQLLDGLLLYPAISGLGETGSATDDDFVAPYSSHQSGKIRRAALKALASLNPNPHLQVFMTALEDEAPSVSKQATKTLSGKTSSLSAARVWEVFSSSTHAHVKRNALSLIETFSKWESISYLLSALCENGEDLVTMSRRFISNWLGDFNRSYVVPTREQETKFRAALERCGELLNEETRRQLQFTLRSY